MTPIKPWHRVAAASAVGLAAGAMLLLTQLRFSNANGDVDPVWFAARALIAGENPYRLVGPGRAFDWPWQLAYPLTAAVAAIPLAPLPLEWARVLFVAGGAGALAYVVLARGWPALIVCASLPFLVAVRGAQWSPWLCASMLGLPIAAWALAAKPNVGLMAMAGTGITRWQIGAGIGLVAIAFALQPRWVGDWIAAVSGMTEPDSYALRPGGFVLLLAALRWRRQEARVLLAASLIPGTPAPYDALVPFVAVVALGPSSLREVLILTIVSFGVLPFLVTGTHQEYIERAANATLVFVLLPLLVTVLKRPNRTASPFTRPTAGTGGGSGKGTLGSLTPSTSGSREPPAIA